jgi:hypothetical protein
MVKTETTIEEMEMDENIPLPPPPPPIYLFDDKVKIKKITIKTSK